MSDQSHLPLVSSIRFLMLSLFLEAFETPRFNVVMGISTGTHFSFLTFNQIWNTIFEQSFQRVCKSRFHLPLFIFSCPTIDDWPFLFLEESKFFLLYIFSLFSYTFRLPGGCDVQRTHVFFVRVLTVSIFTAIWRAEKSKMFCMKQKMSWI